jgi:hypothetical protein
MVWAWGDNRWGQLGGGDTVTLTNMTEFTEILIQTNVTRTTNLVVETRQEIKSVPATLTNFTEVVTWVERHYLDAVDYTDATRPFVRQPVNIPGKLEGISHHGALLYTVGFHGGDGEDGRTEWLDASACDGVSASLVDSMALPVAPRPLLVNGSNLFLGRADTTNQPSRLEAWTLSETTGRFTLLNSVELRTSAQALFSRGELLAAQFTRDANLFHAGTLAPLGSGSAPACLTLDLGHADGDITHGLWVPLLDYGVKLIQAGVGGGVP